MTLSIKMCSYKRIVKLSAIFFFNEGGIQIDALIFALLTMHPVVYQANIFFLILVDFLNSL